MEADRRDFIKAMGVTAAVSSTLSAPGYRTSGFTI
jgi:hypothetical protein